VLAGCTLSKNSKNCIQLISKGKIQQNKSLWTKHTKISSEIELCVSLILPVLAITAVQLVNDTIQKGFLERNPTLHSQHFDLEK